MRKALITGIISLLLVLLTYELPVWLPDTFIKQESLVKLLSHLPSNKSDKEVLAHLKKNFLLVNTTYDMSLAEFNDEEKKHTNYRHMSQATTNITDRKRLYKLLNWLEQHPERYNIIILDMMFNNSSYAPEQKKYDTSISIMIQKLVSKNKVILAADYSTDHIIKKGLLEKHVPDHVYGDARKNVITSDNLAIYALSANEGVTSLPLLLLNRIDSVVYEHTIHRLLKFKYPNGKNKLSLDYLIPQLYIDSSILSKLNKLNYSSRSNDVNMIELGDVYKQTETVLSSNILPDSLGKKNVLIGSFSGGKSDLHATVFGPTKGPLYILNAYYNLREGNSLFKWRAAIFLWLYYFACLGWILFITKKAHKSDTFRKYVLHDIILKNWHYLSLLIVIILYYLLFDQVINLLYISAFFLLLEIFVKIYRNYLEIKVK